MSQVAHPALRPIWIFLPLAVLYLASASRFVVLQAVPQPEKVKSALQRVELNHSLPVHAGRILDRHGQILATHRQRYRLVVNERPKYRRYFTKRYEFDEVAAELQPVASLIGVPPEQVRSHVLGPDVYSVIVGGLSPETAHRLQGLLKETPNTGMRLESYWERVYPQGRALAQFIGFEWIDSKGKRSASGLEAMCRSRLQGEAGRKSALAVGSSFGVNPGLDFQRPKPGSDMQTTLDVILAAQIKERLQQAMLEHRAEWITAVAIDPRNGEFLSAVAVPDLDPNPGRRLEQNPQGGIKGMALPAFWPVEPGSTLKPFILTGAFQQGVLGFDDRYDNEGGIWHIRNPPIKDVRGVPTHPLLPEEILLHSSNICMGKIGLEMKARGLQAVLKAFDFWDPTGMQAWDQKNTEGGPASPGIQPSARQWRRTRWTIPSISMGYQLSFTPVRLAYAYAAIVNGGVMYEPRLFADTPAARSKRVLSEELSEYFKEALMDVVEHAPREPWLQRNPELRWGGKSGTVRILDAVGNLQGRRSLFVGFAPVEDPQIVTVVVVEKPTGKEYLGSRVAGPIVADILNTAMIQRGVIRPESLAALDSAPRRQGMVPGD